MFDGIRLRLRDVGTLKVLCEAAEAHALRDQQREPGAEHFLLAALDLPDGTARRAFDRVVVEPEAVRGAIERQYADALGSIGLTADIGADTTMSATPGIYRAAPSGEEVMQALAARRKDHGPLLGADVVGVVAGMPEGVAARAIRALGLDPLVLKSAANAAAAAGRAG